MNCGYCLFKSFINDNLKSSLSFVLTIDCTNAFNSIFSCLTLSDNGTSRKSAAVSASLANPFVTSLTAGNNNLPRFTCVLSIVASSFCTLCE